MRLFEKLFLKKETKEEPLIHSDFRVRGSEGFWWWNYTNFRVYTSKRNRGYSKIIKVTFAFDDPSLLDGCPFMCKIGLNESKEKDTKWFGVAYGCEDDDEKLESWARRFSRHKLITNTNYKGATLP